MLPDDATCRMARAERRSELDGVVFIGVGEIFCRPSCPTRIPAAGRQRYFASGAAALAAELSPCKRCAPLDAPRAPDHQIEQPLVRRGLRLIEQGFLRQASTAALARQLQVSAGELQAAFAQELGASPAAIARNSAASRALVSARGHKGNLQLSLAVREPYAADWVFDFLDRRSLPGLEHVVDGRYCRRIGKDRWLEVSYRPGALTIEVPRAARATLPQLVGRIAHVFDVHADPRVIDATLKQDQWLSKRVSGGIRVPGAWDGFETAVRAILGQQVSVARARTLAIALVERFAADGFPTPAELCDADVSAIGMPGKRGEAVRQLARAVLDRRLQLDNSADPETLFDTLCGLPGIGPWTAGYVGMRIAGDANAFPRGDWVILKQMEMTAGAAEKYSHAWQPYRAYALMYIWQSS